MITRFINFLRWLFASESLPTEEVADDAHRIAAPKRGFTRWVLRTDTLDTAHPEGLAVARRKRLVRWICAAETLADPPNAPKGASKRSGRFWSWLVCAEVLPPADGDPSPLAGRTMFFRRLIAKEACPEQRTDEEARRVGVARRLLSSEQCPRCPVGPRDRKKSWLGQVLEAEDCPVDPSPTPPRRRGFLRSVLTSEEL